MSDPYADIGDVDPYDGLGVEAPRGRKSQSQGFMKGMSRVVDNLQPVDRAVSFSPAGLAKRGVREIQGWVGDQERRGIESGAAGEMAGQVTASIPTWFVGGPAVSGALSGYSTSGADNLLGKARDAAYGAVGGKVGAAVVGKVANTLAPIVEPAVQRLAQRGIKMTPGQVRGGKSMAREDKLMSTPHVGDKIAAGRRGSIETFNTAAVDEALAPLGVRIPPNVKPGHDAVAFAQDTVSRAYNQVVPRLNAQPDQQFVGGIQRLAPTIKALPEAQQGQIQGILQTVRFGPGGNLSGKKMQDALSEIRRLRSSYGSSAVAGEREMARVLGDVHDEMMAMLIRQNPQDAAALKATNKAFRGLAIMEDAASRADEGIMSTGQLKQAVRRADGTRRKNASAGRKAFMQDFSEDARAVLPAKVPNSGTADRMQQGNLLSNVRGAVSGAAYSVDNALMNAYAKAPPQVQKTIRNLLMSGQRPASVLGALGLSQAGE